MSNYPSTIIDSEMNKDNPDWTVIEEQIIKMGDTINTLDYGDGDRTLLADIIWEHEDCKDLFELTKLFLKHGYDVKANGGKNGAMCLHNLCWFSRDHYLLQVSELLLEAGADISITADENDPPEHDVLYAIADKGSDWEIGSLEEANLYEAYYEQVENYSKGKPFKGIRGFEECIGGRIQKIEKLTFEKKKIEEDVYLNDAFSGSLLMWVDNKPLIISRFVDFRINPYTADEAVNRMDITDEFDEGIIGARVKEVQLIFNGYARIILKKENEQYDRYIQIMADFVFEHGSEYTKFACGSSIQDEEELRGGNRVQWIFLADGHSWQPNVKQYYEKIAVFQSDNKCMIITAEKGDYLIGREIPFTWVDSDTRYIVGGPYEIDRVKRNDTGRLTQIYLFEEQHREELVFFANGNRDIWFVRRRQNEQGEEERLPITFSR